MISQTYRMGELFSGPGGMALGARLAAQAVALSHATNTPLDEILRRSRLALLDDIEGRWS